MTIHRVKIQNYLVFKDEFTANFCPGANVLLGGNGTGKTTLLKRLYEYLKEVVFHRNSPSSPSGKMAFSEGKDSYHYNNTTIDFDITENLRVVYIPEKDILEHARGLLTFIDQKQTGFSDIYRDVLIAAQDVPTKEESETQKLIGQKINAIVNGKIYWDKSENSFYTLKTDGSSIPFANEASGFKKFGFLGLLVSSGQLEPETILFWDEPENSLNPELVPVLVDILLELSQSGVQIFIATHDYNLARYFDIRKRKEIQVMFHNLHKTGSGKILCDSSPEYIELPDNLLEESNAKLFKAVIADAMEVPVNE